MIVRPLKSVWRFARNELSGKPGAVQSRPLYRTGDAFDKLFLSFGPRTAR
jgi:hypothetical protein